MNRARGVGAAILLAWLVLPTLAQQNPQPVPRFRSGIDLIAVDVSVLDRDRRPVRGLTAADFTMFENGRPQPITAFSAVELPDVDVEETAPAAAWVRAVAPDVRRNSEFNDGRVVVIALDDATPMPAAEVPRVKDLARRAIEFLGPRDLAAVVFAVNKSAGQEFTQDRARLLAAVERFQGSPDRASAPAVPFDAFDNHNLTMYHMALDTLRSVADYLVDLPDRRKALIWVSVGAPIDWEMAQSGMISLEDPGSATRSGRAQDVIKSAREALASAQRANVAIYGLDPGGLRAPNNLAAPSADETHPGKLNADFVAGISASTGGFAIVDVNDPVAGIRQVFRENGSYYLLGYVPADSRAQGRFRRIEVRVNRPGVTVRARNGYFEPTRARGPASAPAASNVVQALTGVMPKSDLEMQVSAAPFAAPGRRQGAVAVVLGVRQAAPARATRVVQNVDLRIVVHSPDGRQRASQHVTVPVTLNTTGAGGTMGYELLSHVDLAPGRYYVRVAAETSLHGIQLAPRAPAVGLVGPSEDTTNKSGSVYCDLDVPDFLNDEVSLSGVVLGVTPGVVSGPKDALASIVPLVPTTLREFTRDDKVTAFLRAYQGGKNALAPVSVAVRIVDANDTRVFESKQTLEAERFARDRAADYFVQLPISRLNRGPYLFTIEAASGHRTVRRDVRFQLR